MKINKEIVSKIPRDYVFITGTFDIDALYFKKRIEEGVKVSSLNYKTNVHGQQTDWKFFNKDEKLALFLLQVIDYIDNLNLPLQAFYLHDCWGLIERFGDYTKKHKHGGSLFSGVLYLNNHSQKLYFPEIKEEVTPTAGGFVIFTSFLTHHTHRNITHKEKYAISFNFNEDFV